MSISKTVDLLAAEALIFGIVWVFYSASTPVVAVILFVALHLIAHNGHVGFDDKTERLRRSHHPVYSHDDSRWWEEAPDE